MGNARAKHEHIRYIIQAILLEFVRPRKLGVVYAETGFVLSEDTLRMPDVSVVLTERLKGVDPSRQFRIVPNIAIEVISDTEKTLETETKLAQYLRANVGEVWQVYPELERVVILTRAGRRDLAGVVSN